MIRFVACVAFSTALSFCAFQIGRDWDLLNHGVAPAWTHLTFALATNTGVLVYLYRFASRQTLQKGCREEVNGGTDGTGSVVTNASSDG